MFWFLWDVKRPTLLFVIINSRRRRPRWCGTTFHGLGGNEGVEITWDAIPILSPVTELSHPCKFNKGMSPEVLTKRLIWFVRWILFVLKVYKRNDYNMNLLYTVFALTWPASMQIYWNKRKRLYKKGVQLPQDLFGTPIWPLWRNVKLPKNNWRRRALCPLS